MLLIGLPVRLRNDFPWVNPDWDCFFLSTRRCERAQIGSQKGQRIMEGERFIPEFRRAQGSHDRQISQRTFDGHKGLARLLMPPGALSSPARQSQP